MRSKRQWYEGGGGGGGHPPNVFFLWKKEIKSNHTSESYVLMRRIKKQQMPDKLWMN